MKQFIVYKLFNNKKVTIDMFICSKDVKKEEIKLSLKLRKIKFDGVDSIIY